MRQALTIHRDSRCEAVSRIDVDIDRPRMDMLVLRYTVTGIVSALRLPATTLPARTDDLWQHTCFEAFVRAEPGTGYAEFNFAPSTQWAAYLFDGFRSGMRVINEVGSPLIEMQTDGASFALRATLALDGLSGLADAAIWRLGLSAVMEEASGRLSYWALAHPPGKADFHHPDCFAITLPAPLRP